MIHIPRFACFLLFRTVGIFFGIVFQLKLDIIMLKLAISQEILQVCLTLGAYIYLICLNSAAINGNHYMSIQMYWTTQSGF